MRRIHAWFIIGLLALLSALAATAQDAAAPSAAWRPGMAYDAGKVVTFENAVYKCIYSHIAVSGWEPAKVPALWRPVGIRGPVSEREAIAPLSQTKRIFAPYIHMSETDNNLPAIHAASKIRFFTLAFIVSDGGCSPAWQGEKPLKLSAENHFAQHLDGLRKSGGDVIISFGGYVGQELALACPDVPSLLASYQTVVDKYHAKSLDFDIEAGAATDAASLERRSEALSRLARANPRLQISFTVPVFPNGMPQTALDLLKSAKEHGVPVAVVNLMTMDYGNAVPDGNMGPAAIVAVENAVAQLRLLGLDAAIGITPMIGMNDTPGETFTVADASTVFTYARSNKAVRRLSMWSVGRDHGSCIGKVSPVCSGIAQDDWEFTRIFQRF